MFTHLARRDHPASKFGVENLLSLKKTNNTDSDPPLSLYSALKSFHAKYYNAKNMNLVLQSTSSLEELQKIAVELCSVIPTRAESVMPMEGLGSFMGITDVWSDMYGDTYEVVAAGNQNLQLIFKLKF